MDDTDLDKKNEILAAVLREIPKQAESIDHEKDEGKLNELENKLDQE